MSSANHRIAIASKTVTGQYGSSTVLQQVNVQSVCYTLLCVGRGALTVGGVVPKLRVLMGVMSVKYHCLQRCYN